MIYTFYSYKGGVGRSMALANVAEWLYGQGLRVVIIDWDLEAPGLENFYFDAKGDLELIRSQLGLIDMLLAYKRLFPRLPLLAPGGRPGTQEDANGGESPAAILEKNLAILEERLQPVSDLLYPVHAPSDDGDGDGRALWMLTSGWRAGDRFPVYAQAVQSFDWSDFYASYQGEVYFEWMRRQLVAEDLADVVLIDSRTGVTEMGGVCTRQMADVVVSFCVPNTQNLVGVATMVKSFGREELARKRERELEVVVVPTRIDVSELEARNRFEQKFHEVMDDFIPAAFKTVNSNFWDLYIQYIPNYAYDEKLAINREGAKELRDAYARLGAHLALLAKGKSGLRMRRAMSEELKEIFGGRLPSGFISYEGDEGEAVARDLHERLRKHGVTLWANLAEMKGKFGSWPQVAGILDQSRFLVLVLTPDAMQSEMVQKQLRYAHEQGVNVFLVGGGSDGHVPNVARLPSWLQKARVFDFTRDDELEQLVSQLQSSAPAARVPFMAPDPWEGYVPRPALSARLKECLLKSASGGSANAALWGPGGSGKTAEATAFCQDDEVASFFEDGILWSTLGAEPNITGELTKLYAALTGERPPFVDEEDASVRLSEKLVEKRCLIVLEDVVSAQHLQPFMRRGNNCSRLITTRDANVAFGVNAELIEMGCPTRAEAVEIVGANLPLSSKQRESLGELAERLSDWPLALRLANAELRKRTRRDGDFRLALENLRREVEKSGALAFDEPNAPEAQQAVSRTIAPILDALSKEDRERYVQLAFYPESSEINLSDISELWGEDEIDSGKRIQRLADVALLRYDPQRKTVKLHSVIRDYILNRLSDKDGLSEKIEDAFAHFSDERKESARRILTRLVRLARPDEGSDDTRLRCKLSDFDPDLRDTVKALAEARLLNVEQDKAGGDDVVQIANEAFIKGWKRLHDWVEGDREFLLWRQQLRDKVTEWEGAGRDTGALLSGAPLEVARRRREERAAELNESERLYVDESERESGRVLWKERRARVRGYAVVTLILLVVGAGALLIYRSEQRAERMREAEAEALVERAKFYDNLGDLSAAKGDFDSAVINYTEAIAAKSDYAEAYFDRAAAYEHEQDFDKAIADYRKAIEIKPDYAEAYFALADIYRRDEVGDNDEAIAYYSSAIKLNPDYADAYLNRGYTYESLGKLDQALADYNEAIRIETAANRQNATAYLRRGLTYQQTGDKDNAIADLQKAVESTVDPELRAKATLSLRQLGFTKTQPPAVPESSAPKVFLQFNNSQDSAILKRVADDLRGAGFAVQDPELRSERTRGSIRYYYPEDKQNAERVMKAVAAALSNLGYPTDMQLSYLGNVFLSVPRGNIEVWLPQLQKGGTPIYEPQQQGPPRQRKPPSQQGPQPVKQSPIEPAKKHRGKSKASATGNSNS